MSPRKKKDQETDPVDETDDTAPLGPEDVEPLPDDPAEIAEVVVPPPAPVVPSSPALPPCALESASVGTKCVVSRPDESGKVVRLINGQGAIELPKDDVFYTLPPGAKVTKRGETIYIAERLGVNDKPLFTVSSAREAVTRFLTEVN